MSHTIDWFPQKPDWTANGIRLLAETFNGGGDLFEIFRTSQRLVGHSDNDAWRQAWTETADTVMALAHEALAQGHTVTARSAFLRACNYYRQAEFYLSHDDPEKARLYAECQSAFHQALPLMQPTVESISIPYEGTELPGYFCHPVGNLDERRPAVLLMGGADSLAEELYFMGAGICQRGAYLLLVDMPGRGAALRRQNLKARPDYEVPGRVVLDWLASHPLVDPERIGLWGTSMGGYYAPRVAAGDSRVKALALNSACFDVAANLYDFYAPLRQQMQWVVGASNPEETRARLAEFNLRDAAPSIQCPTYIAHGEDDIILDVQGAYDLYERLTCPKTLRIWPSGQPGTTHCSWDHFEIAIPEMEDWLLDRI